MLRLVGSQNPAKIEEELRTIVAAPGESLQLPVHPKEWWLGGELGLIELAITWARLSDSGSLVTYILPNDDPTIQLQGMATRLFGFVALMMAPEILDKTASPERTLRPIAYEECRKIVEMMFGPVTDFKLGSKVFLVSVDHSTRWMIPWLYAPTGIVGDRIAFITLARELVTKVTQSFAPPTLPYLTYARLGAILHELFKNTDEWAVTDSTGVPWRRSVRGLAAERHAWTAEQLNDIADDNPALKAYFQSLAAHATTDRLRFLEFTVFDSGLGLARRWLDNKWAADIPMEAEYFACLECLKKHRTSSSRGDKGVGLAEVMSTLSLLHGFLKIRTGRLSLYRDFVNSPLHSSGTDVQLHDFASASTVLTQLARIYGTHFQMLIPLL